MRAYRLAPGIDAYFAFLGQVLEEGQTPELVERGAADSFDFAESEHHPDPSMAALARERLYAADWRSVEELSLAARDPRADLGACARLALAVLRRGEAALDAHADPARIAVRDAARRVRVELHRLLGILRFSPLGARAWQASCQPDNEVLELLLPHFSARFGSDADGPIPYAIRDVGRRIVVGRDARGEPFGPLSLDGAELLSRLGVCAVQSSPGAGVRRPLDPGEKDQEPLPAPDDHDELLWRTYFQAAGNPARSNPSLQRRFVPQRYREWLPEFRG